MITKFRKILAACSIFGACSAMVTIASVNPINTSDALVHTRADAVTADANKRKGRRNLLRGIASWYGAVLDGHRTASGEIFDKDAMTACHPTLPFGTMVRVINLRNRESVVVRINDRGILYPDRVIDLSSAAAERIGMLRRGIAPVKLEVLPKGAS